MKLGIIGAGQLAKMLALAAQPLGITVFCLANKPDEPAKGVAQLLDQPAFFQCLPTLDVITFETENVSPAIIEQISQHPNVYPTIHALTISQDRLHEKNYLQRLGIPTTRYCAVNSADELQQAIEKLQCPCILKTRCLGYDGKGQYRIKTPQDSERAWQTLQGSPLICEAVVDFATEVSLLAVRSRDDTIAYYPLAENQHQQGILRQSTVPFVNPSLQQQAQQYAQQLLVALKYSGVLAIEFFVKDHQLYVNEIAPRVHNSGHWSIEAARTSQFENHIRAIFHLPLGSCELLSGATMFNYIGTIATAKTALVDPNAHYHHYGKQPRPNRKLGHLTVLATNTKNTKNAKNAKGAD